MIRSFALVIALATTLQACQHVRQSESVRMLQQPSKYHVGQNVQGSHIVEREHDITIIQGNGGWVLDWAALAHYTLAKRKTLKIMNDCISACTVAADMVRRLGGKVCVGERAVFSYHNAMTGRAVYSDASKYYSKEIAEWVANNGGWNDWFDWTFMKDEDLEQFYNRC